MIKITNDKNTFEVTSGVFESQFKNLGYRVVGNNESTNEKVVENNIDSADKIDKIDRKEEKEINEEGMTRKLQRDRK
jgi:hypothetical protein